MFIDGDDWTESHMVEQMLAACLKEDAQAVLAGFYVDFEDGANRICSSKRRVPEPGVMAMDDGWRPAVTPEFIGILGYAWNKMYLRTALAEEGATFVVGLSLVEDAVFNSVALRAVDTIVLLDNAFVHYMQRPHTTLGTKYYPDFFDLRCLADDAVRSLLQHWKFSDTAIAEAQLPGRYAALFRAVKMISTEGSIPLGQRRRVLLEFVAKEEVMALLRPSAAHHESLRPNQSLVLRGLRQKRLWPLLIFAEFRERVW
jgi:hypothetical protein